MCFIIFISLHVRFVNFQFGFWLYADYTFGSAVGDKLVFGCEDGMVFEHNRVITPEIELEVLPDGTMTEPDFWPNCVYRESRMAAAATSK